MLERTLARALVPKDVRDRSQLLPQGHQRSSQELNREPRLKIKRTHPVLGKFAH